MFAIVLKAALHHTSFANWTNGWKTATFSFFLFECYQAKHNINWNIEWRQQTYKLDGIQST